MMPLVISKCITRMSDPLVMVLRWRAGPFSGRAQIVAVTQLAGHRRGRWNDPCQIAMHARWSKRAIPRGFSHECKCDKIRVDSYTAVPAGSRIHGVVTFAQAADRQKSGVIEVNFDRLTLPDGKAY